MNMKGSSRAAKSAREELSNALHSVDAVDDDACCSLLEERKWQPDQAVKHLLRQSAVDGVGKPQHKLLA
jgi:hypothetical protein